MTAILGISAYYHDSAAALVVDGRIVAAAQEERFTRRKHDYRFPAQAVDYCLAESGLSPSDLDLVGFYDKPLLKFDRLLESYLAYAPLGFRSFLKAMPMWLKTKLHLPREIARHLRGQYRRRIVFAQHHQSHAASAFFPSPFDESAILTIDGVGEWATASYGVGRGNRVHLERQLSFPHSLGLLYSAFTYFCGFRVNSGEYKLMGLAPYGRPIYADLIRDKLIDLRPDGSFRMNMRYFNYCQGLTMTNRRFARLIGGGPTRRPESPITDREMDLAASVQQVTEQIMLAMARHVRQETRRSDLCLAGGVALNCVGNGRLMREAGFEQIWIQPAAGDAGGALGVALLIWHQLMDQPRTAVAPDSQQGSLLGPDCTTDRARVELDALGARYRELPDEDAVCAEAARLLEAGNVVGWVQGRMEFGPRALGGRSILGDPRRPEMQKTMNLKIKFRESFRPFAPSVLAERAADYFDLPPDQASPYMLLVAPVSEKQRLPCPAPDTAANRLEQRHQARSSIPAVTHVDDSARLQTVDRDQHPRFWKLLKSFEQRTGCPLLVNTSFNVRGEPIVCSAGDAYRCFMATGMDVLFVDRLVLFKNDQPNARPFDIESHLNRFDLD